MSCQSLNKQVYFHSDRNNFINRKIEIHTLSYTNITGHVTYMELCVGVNHTCQAVEGII